MRIQVRAKGNFSARGLEFCIKSESNDGSWNSCNGLCLPRSGRQTEVSHWRWSRLFVMGDKRCWGRC